MLRGGSLGLPQAAPPAAPPQTLEAGVSIGDDYQSRPKTAFYTVTEAGLYRISGYMFIAYTVPEATGDFNMTLYWQDPVGERSVVSNTASIVSWGAVWATATTWCAPGNVFSYDATFFNGASGSRSYQLYIRVEKVT